MNLTPETLQLITTGVIIPLLIWGVRTLSKLVDHKIKDAAVTKHLGIAEDAVCTAVTAVSQTYVDSLKKQGTFDQAAREEAFALSKQKALEIMGTTGAEVLKGVYKDINPWLDSKIEYYVNTGKI